MLEEEKDATQAVICNLSWTPYLEKENSGMKSVNNTGDYLMQYSKDEFIPL